MEDGDNPAPNAPIASGSKRSFGDLEDDENDGSGSKKVCTKVDKADPEVAAALILSFQESLQKCKDDIASCQNELESAKTELESAKAEVNKWKSAFEKESFVPARTSPEPGFVVDYVEKLRSSETSLKEQLEIAQMKLAIRDLKSQLKPASVQEVEVEKGRCLRVVTLPDNGESSSSPAFISIQDLMDELQAANTLIAELREVQAVDLAEMRKTQAKHTEFIEYYGNIAKLALEKKSKLGSSTRTGGRC
ncbi:hypothetical protein AALP_AA5G175300 [Arabis alpina]|uniref:FKBP12-interacting protein of 37 kDa n=1 Tax=Arabis alpina TaxID=50452 RepID=A0A087GXR1_ARAAL|nr:hypothetical protein AALP_AA5G175300 [Arabis alpina]